jgi:hypothetical protein
VAQWTETFVHTHLKNLEEQRIPDLPGIPIIDDVLFLWDLAPRVLRALPLSALARHSISKEKILRLTDDLMVWTINENTPAADDPHGYRTHAPHEWNSFFLDWVSQLTSSLSLEEARQHVLTPIRRCWPSAPRLTGELLWGYIKNHLGFMTPPTEDAQDGWREMCHWVLDGPLLAREIRHHFLTRDIADAVSLIVFVRYGETCLKKEWPHAIVFSDVIDKWVSVVGSHPDAYRNLVVMLESLGEKFMPEPALTWLSRCVSNTANSSDFWKKHSNGESTAELLQNMWNRVENVIRANTATLQQYAALVDRLVVAGIPLAGLLQKKLDQ